jgi:thiamine-phosphate diphosphorylase
MYTDSIQFFSSTGFDKILLISMDMEPIEICRGIYPIINVDPMSNMDEILDWALTLYDQGIRMVQVRAKMFSEEMLPGILDEMVSNLKGSGLAVILNDYVELVGVTGGDGVHVGIEDYPVSQARSALGRDAIIGGTCRNSEQAFEAIRQGATYIAAGSVYESGTKSGVPVIGTDGLKRIVEEVKRTKPEIPICAIGGINSGNIREVHSAGADMVAVIGAVQGDSTPSQAARDLVKMWISFDSAGD